MIRQPLYPHPRPGAEATGWTITLATSPDTLSAEPVQETDVVTASAYAANVARRGRRVQIVSSLDGNANTLSSSRGAAGAFRSLDLDHAPTNVQREYVC